MQGPAPSSVAPLADDSHTVDDVIYPVVPSCEGVVPDVGAFTPPHEGGVVFLVLEKTLPPAQEKTPPPALEKTLPAGSSTLVDMLQTRRCRPVSRGFSLGRRRRQMEWARRILQVVQVNICDMRCGFVFGSVK